LVTAVAVLRARRASKAGFLATKVPFHLALVLLLTPVAFLSAVGFFGSLSWRLDTFAYFRLQYTVVLGLGVAILLLVRKWRWALVAAVFLLPNLAVVAPYGISWPRADASGSGPTLRLALVNVNTMNQNHESVKEFLFRIDADVIVLEEIDADWVEALTELDSRYPHSMKVPLRSNFGIGLWSRLPLESSEAVTFDLPGVPSLAATVDVKGKPLRILATHPLPPRDARNTDSRNKQLEGIAALAGKGGSHSVVLGDLNTTPWGSAFRKMVDGTGLRDSGLGMGLQWSWPVGLWPLALPIDHCLVSEKVDVVDRWMGPDVGSDHYPLVVDVRLVD
jgi:endonuclease/exonuclease/phosphatase (EEP) superfamily protein YafD